MNIALIYLYMLLLLNSENAYQKAETQANLVLSLPHEDKDSFSFCEGKLKSVILKDSVINKPGGIGTEYNYQIYRYETEIVYYKNGKIASFENKEIHLKRYEYGGVTTGIQITATLDSLNTFYFDQEQNLITRTQLLEIQSKICKEKE